MAWAKPLYTREQVNAAARDVLAYDPEDASAWERYAAYEAALPIVNNWRSSHNFPLNTFQMNLRSNARAVSGSPLVAQRIKRLRSIVLKLQLQPKMKLSQMQDIGGCRAVVKNISEVRQLAQRYALSTTRHQLMNCDDYLQRPRPTGYRGVHLNYRYVADERPEYNDLKIEIQLRSQFQHAWATAVETVSAFTLQALKSNIGQREWLRFFELMGTAVARREESPPVPNTPDEEHVLRAEITHYARSLNAWRKFVAFRSALRILGKRRPAMKDAKIYLMELDAEKEELSITGFPASQRQRATELYFRADKATSDRKIDAVLVAVDSVTALQRAYPNYFADTRIFLELLSQAMSGKIRRINIGSPVSDAAS